MPWNINYLEEAENITVSLGDILDAIEQNGLPKACGTYWRVDSGSSERIIAACAIGQGALNLGVPWGDLDSELRKFKVGRNSLNHSIASKNDNEHWSLKRIANHYREQLSSQLNTPVHLRRKYTVDKGA